MAARRVANHISSEHFERTFTAEEVAEVLPHVIDHLESADVDLVRSAVPNHFAAKLARQHVKAVLTGEGADELFAGYAYHHAYVDEPRQLAEELMRSLGIMHNINMQRVDRITMAESLEARTPFLDRELIDFAQSIQATLKLRRTDPSAPDSTGPTTEKWILRKACEDLLPHDLVWRKKAPFDEGSSTVDALGEALRILAGTDESLDREGEAALYERLLRQQCRPGSHFAQCRHVDVRASSLSRMKRRIGDIRHSRNTTLQRIRCIQTMVDLSGGRVVI